MTQRKNIIANYIGLGAVALAPIIALPWYFSALGPKLFGLVGFVTTLQTLLGLLDSGMSQALVREFSVRFNVKQKSYNSAAALLFGFERVYWLFAIFAGIVTMCMAGTIAEHWLQTGDLPSSTGREAIYGAAIIFGMQFPGSVYRSVLLGAQAQVRLNALLFCCTLIRHGGGVLLVTFHPTIFAYLTWLATIALLETALRGKLAWGVVHIPRSLVSWELCEIRPVFSWVAGMSAATWLGALTVQMDKIILSRMISIEQFGYYVIASTVASGMLQLVYPVVQAVMPRAIQLRSDRSSLFRLYTKMSFFFMGLVVCAALVYVTAGRQLLGSWLRNPAAADAVYPLISILLIGTTLNTFYNIGYVNWIVQEKIMRILQVNILALALALVLIPLLVNWQGVSGAAIGWLSINLVGFLFSLGWLELRKNPKSIHRYS